MPADDADLETIYSAQEIIDVGSKDDIRVSQLASGEYAVHQFKDYVGDATSVTLEWEGRTDYAPGSSTVYLQIYNQDTDLWETIDSDNSSSVNVDFPLTAGIGDLTNYKDASKVICCRVYQRAV